MMPRASIGVYPWARFQREPGGGNWWNDDDAGSRQANLVNPWPDNSNDNIGARGRCEHDLSFPVRPSAVLGALGHALFADGANLIRSLGIEQKGALA